MPQENPKDQKRPSVEAQDEGRENCRCGSREECAWISLPEGVEKGKYEPNKAGSGTGKEADSPLASGRNAALLSRFISAHLDSLQTANLELYDNTFMSKCGSSKKLNQVGELICPS